MKYLNKSNLQLEIVINKFDAIATKGIVVVRSFMRTTDPYPKESWNVREITTVHARKDFRMHTVGKES